MKAIIDDLNVLGKEIEKAKTNVSQLEGRKTEVVNRLKEEFGVSTLAEVEALVATSEKELVVLEQDITTEYNKLKDNFQW